MIIFMQEMSKSNLYQKHTESFQFLVDCEGEKHRVFPGAISFQFI